MNLIEKLTLPAAIVIAGLMLPLAVSDYKSYERTVDVKGLCEREVKADKVIWPITFKVVGNDLSAVLKEAEKNNSVIRDYLVNGGLDPEHILAGALSINDKYANEYGNNDRVYRFLCTGTITVCSPDVSKVMALRASQGELIKLGVVLYEGWDNQMQFKFEGLNDIKPEMIEEATAGARAAAEKFAKDSGSRIGKIKTASQGTFSIEDRDSNTPQLKRVRVVTYVTYYLKN